MSKNNKQKNPLEYISLSEAAKEYDYTPEHLNFLARRGKLQAKKIGRNWHTTLAWMEDFVNLNTKIPAKQKMENLSSYIAGYTSGQIKILKEKSESEIISAGPDKLQRIAKQKEKFSPDETKIKFNFWKSANIFSTMLVAMFLLFAIFQAGRFLKVKNYPAEDDSIATSWNPSEAMEDRIYSENGIVKGEEASGQNVGTQTGPELVSENYKIPEIKFGGAIAMASVLENPNFEIYDIRSEVMTNKSKEESRILIRWATSRLALSGLEYSKMNGNNPKTLKEDSYGFTHSAVLSNLEPGTAYTYVIKSTDRWSNEINSDRYSAYTGSKTVSVFDLIINAVKEVFGWAIKK